MPRQYQASHQHVKEMAQNLVTLQIGVHTVVETVKLDLIKVSLQFNKHVHNVMVMVKKSLIRVMTVMAKEKNKLLRKYQLQFQKVLMMELELD